MGIFMNVAFSVWFDDRGQIFASLKPELLENSTSLFVCTQEIQGFWAGLGSSFLRNTYLCDFIS